MIKVGNKVIISSNYGSRRGEIGIVEESNNPDHIYPYVVILPDERRYAYKEEELILVLDKVESQSSTSVFLFSGSIDRIEQELLDMLVDLRIFKRKQND